MKIILIMVLPVPCNTTLANEYILLLLSNGLRFDSGRADLEIVDQNKGPINDCK